MSTPDVAVLVDAGLSGKETMRRLDAAGVRSTGTISAICLTHEHSDHISGLSALSTRLKAPIYANSGTIEAARQAIGERRLDWHVFITGQEFKIGQLDIEPFSVCHDAYDPVGFVFSSGGCRVGIVTDIGIVTSLVREKLRNCAALVIEANHDERMLRDSDRPWPLKQRIAGRQGHLSNNHAGELVAECAGPALKRVYLAHLSSECNRPEIAADAVRKSLCDHGFDKVEVIISHQDSSTDLWTVA